MSVSPQSFFDFNEIWYVDGGRWVPYDPIQGQGHGASEVPKTASLSPLPFTMGAGKWPLILKLQHYLNLIRPYFWYLSYFLCHVTLNLHVVSCSVLFLSCPRSEGWPHHGRTFSIYLCSLSFWLTLPQRVLSTTAVMPRLPALYLTWYGILSYTRHLP